MTDELRRLADLATGQHGIITTRQIGAAGMSDGVLRGRIQSGTLERVGVHVVRSPFAPATAISDLCAFVLDCGIGAVASGPSAAALHGFDGISLRPPFHVTVPRGRTVRRARNYVHTTTELPGKDRCTVRDIAVMSPTRTLIDLARFVRPATLTAALDSAIRDRLTTEDFLHRRINELRSSGRYGIPRLLDVIAGSEVTRGGHTWLERRFLEICAAGRLPRPNPQQVLTRAGDRLVRVDFHFPGTNVVVEVLGYRWHRTKAQMANDATRLNALVLAGKVPLQFTYDQVTLDEAMVLALVRRALGLA